MKYYPRQIEQHILKLVSQFRVVAITGARQTGKSTLLKKLFPKYNYVSLDNPRDLSLAQKDPELFFEQYPSPLIIDEIQYAPSLLHYIKIHVDRLSQAGQFIITGSQKFVFIKGLQESLAGRIALVDLYPMAIGEGPVISRNFERRVLEGSFPEPLCAKKDTDTWFASYISTYIERDVEHYFHLEKIQVFKDFVFLLAARIGQILNYQSLASDLGVSVHAVRTWLKILEASQIIYLLRPYYVNLGSRIIKSPKVYFTDIGLVGFMTGVRDKKSLWRTPQAGALFENFVIQELLKFFANRGKPAPLYYYRTNNGLEIDLIIQKRPLRIIPCEIKLNKTPRAQMTNSMTRLRGLNKKKNVIIEAGYIVCLSDGKFHLTKDDQAVSLNVLLTELDF